MRPTRIRSVPLPWWNSSSRYIGRAVAATFLCALFVAQALAVETKTPAPNGPAIPPGEEELLAEMLGRGQTLAGECALASAAVEYTIVKATYTCKDGNAVVELAHPSTAPRTTIQTKAFSITLQSGSPPHSLLDTLVSLIRAREDAFEWEWLPSDDEEATDDDAGDE